MKKELIVQRNPKSPISETFRTLRTNIQFMNSQKSLRTILVTSTMPGEGKSWVSANLAITFAQSGKRVVLIDADMRKGRLASLFQVEKVPGLSNFLSGIDEKGTNENIDIVKYIKQTEVDNLFLITTGNMPPNPAELLETEATVKMMDRLKEIFDVIIVDGTPSLLVTDAIILSRIVDTTLLVASYKSTKKDDLTKVKKSIENVGGKIAGVILNKMPVKAKEYNSSYYYGSKSSSTSKHHMTKEERIEERNDFKQKQEEDNTENNTSDEQKKNIMSQLNNYLNHKD